MTLRSVCRAVRQVIAPAGKHRPHRVEETVTLPVLMRPAEAMVNDTAWCPAEQRNRLHAFLRTGGRMCWTCRTYTGHRPLTSTPEVDRG